MDEKYTRQLVALMGQEWVDQRFAFLEQDESLTLRAAAELTGIPYTTLHGAVKSSRVTAQRQGATWLVTRRDIKTAIEAGRLRGKRNRRGGNDESKESQNA